MKIAIVYDRIIKVGGAERVLSTLHEMWPDAPFFTAVYDRKKAPFAKSFDIQTTFLQHIPFAKNTLEWFPWLTPLAFEMFDFHAFDAVITVTSAEAKSIITSPDICHICYCLTPTRYLWSAARQYERIGIPGFILRLMAPTLRRWDLIASKRPDFMVGISHVVETRIKKYYKRLCDEVIYPPVDTAFFERNTDAPKNCPFPTGSYLLSVGRLVYYKRFDRVIDTCQKNNIPLLIIGRGAEGRALRSKASSSVRIISNILTDEELRSYYHDCRAFVFGGREDFGIVAVEAAAAGKAILCPNESGMAEIVNVGETGMLFDDTKDEAFGKALKIFFQTSFDPQACKNQARLFDRSEFMRDFRAFVESSVLSYNRRV